MQELDPLAVAQLFTFQTTFEERSVVAGETWPEYEPPRFGRSKPSSEGVLHELESRLWGVTESADAGVYVSSGLDGASIAHLQDSDSELLTAYYMAAENPECAAAEELAEHLECPLTRILVGSDDMRERLEETVETIKNPVAGISYVNLMAAEAGETTIRYSGEGGDELFGSYSWRYTQLPHIAAADFEEHYLNARRRFPATLLRDKFLKSLPEAPEAAARRLLAKSKGLPNLHRAMPFDFATLVRDIVNIEERCHAKFGRTVEWPYLNPVVRDYVADLHWTYKYPSYKPLLRSLMLGYLPDRYFSQPKVGFVPPDAVWYRLPENKEFLSGLILSKDACWREYLRAEWVESAFKAHMEGRYDYAQQIWSIAAFETLCTVVLC